MGILESAQEKVNNMQIIHLYFLTVVDKGDRLWACLVYLLCLSVCHLYENVTQGRTKNRDSVDTVQTWTTST